MSPVLNIKKRNKEIVPFSVEKIENAICKAFLNITREEKRPIAKHISELVHKELEFESLTKENHIPTVEHIQDLVEKHIMEAGFFDVAKEYIIYRYEHQKIREQKKAEDLEKLEESALKVTKRDGRQQGFSEKRIRNYLSYAIKGYEKDINVDKIVEQLKLEVYDGISTKEIARAIVMVVRSMIELDPAYSYVASRLLLVDVYKEATGMDHIEHNELDKVLRESFVKNIKWGIEKKYYDERMSDFDLEKLAEALDFKRDDLIMYMGTQTLHERYFVRDTNDTRKIIEHIQGFWLRIAMGLALLEKPEVKIAKTIEFYNIMSTTRFVPSSPTLFHSGTHHPQLSSCYLNSVGDSLESIFKVYSDNAQLSKWAGGIGTSWTNVRASGALVKKSGIQSNGIVPFLKIANDVTVAINRSGRRRGATAVYLENWHYDVEEFLELRKNTGDERRRTHDMNTALWISDLFMKRVRDDGEWYLFSPDEVPQLSETFGDVFEKHYDQYCKMAETGEIKLFKKMKARDLWKKQVTMLFETGHPWITWKDPSNVRSPQDHVGIVRNSNLCTEITLNNNLNETAVCNLGSFNYEVHVIDGKFQEAMVAETIKTAMRMLDNVIDINYYPTIEAQVSNMRHRPVGLGVMGFHDALYKLNINFDTEEAVIFADESMEVISYNAIMTSAQLAEERGAYETFKGSKWDKDILPQDTVKLLENARGESIEVMKGGKLDWAPVRAAIKKFGMRNSNCMAIAPTATISNIVGTVPCIEPIYKNIFVKANMNGDFIVINSYLTKELKALGLWDYEMIGMLKYHDGSVKNIPQVPQHLKDKYKEVFEIDPKWLLRTAAYRGKWIDQSQSLNIYYSGSSGKELASIYEYAWKLGLKTTYYLRTLGASQVEKSTVNTAEFGVTHKRGTSEPTTVISGITENKPVEGYVSTMQVSNANASHSHLEKEPVFVMSKPLEIPKDAPKVQYNITKAPEATCDGCQ